MSAGRINIVSKFRMMLEIVKWLNIVNLKVSIKDNACCLSLWESVGLEITLKPLTLL